SSSQAVACGEFGGIWMGVTNHTWTPGSGEITPAQANVSFVPQFQTMASQVANLVYNQGLSAAVYTEISDVEIELAGLRTYDRKLLKPNLAAMQAAITAPMARYTNAVLIPTAAVTPGYWHYTLSTPAGTWNTTGYDDSAWSTGPAGFGTAGTPVIPVNTTWNTADIWLRQTFNPGSLTPTQLTNLQFNVFHDEGCEIYLNGVLAASATNYTTGYVHLPLSLAGRNALILNTTNVLAVHCHQTTGGQGIDVGLDITTLAVPAPSSFTPNWTENGPGLTAQYFSDPQLTTPAFTETDPNLSYFWAYNSPGPGLPGNNFSVRWSGWIQPRYTEGYTFHFVATDGCRLWINDQLIVNKWYEDTNSDVTGSIDLVGGQKYSLRAEFIIAPTRRWPAWIGIAQARCAK
ncbi:MAG TPA: PA14 domain-containing protein, partial [Verrucomicrobiae bacterium]